MSGGPFDTERQRRAELHTEVCACGHKKDKHELPGFDGECVGDGCKCRRFRSKGAVAAPTTRHCTKCGQDKPAIEFYSTGSSGKLKPYCRDCDNTRPRARSLSKIVRVRARHRATAELVRRHQDEFGLLLNRYTAQALAEADGLAATTAGQQKYAGDKAAVRLRPGPRRANQGAEERIDVARCPDCIRHHDRGHVCESCGVAPQSLEKAAG